MTCWFKCWKSQLLFFSTNLITLGPLIWKWIGLFLKKKKTILKYWDYLPLLNLIVALTFSLLLKLQEHRSLDVYYEVSFFWGCSHLYKSTIEPCIEYCCHVWASGANCYLDMLDKLLKRVSRTVGSWLTVFLDPLAHCQNVASLRPFYRYVLLW